MLLLLFLGVCLRFWVEGFGLCRGCAGVIEGYIRKHDENTVQDLVRRPAVPFGEKSSAASYQKPRWRPTRKTRKALWEGFLDYLEGQWDLLSRLMMGITRVTI